MCIRDRFLLSLKVSFKRRNEQTFAKTARTTQKIVTSGFHQDVYKRQGYQFEQVYESPKRVLRQIAKVYKFIKNEQPEKKRGESYLLLYKQFCRKCAGGDAAHYGRRT